MIKLLTRFFEFLGRLLSWVEDRQVRVEARERTIKEMNDAINAALEEADAAIATPDPERDERLRARFDRAAPGADPSGGNP